MITQDYPKTSLQYLLELSDESFVQATVGDLEGKSPYGAILTLHALSETCSGLAKKVNRYWGAFIHHAGNTSLLLFPPFFNTKKHEKPRDILKQQFPALKKWKDVDLNKWVHTNPKIEEIMLDMSEVQYVINNHLGNPELWLFHSYKQLKRIDLITRVTSYLNLNELTKEPCIRCDPCLAYSGKWIAICCEDIKEQKMEIAIFEINSGRCCDMISMTDAILQMHCEGQFLYVLCSDVSGQSKLLQYDSNHWNASPKELNLPEKNVFKFYLGCNELLFISLSGENQYRLSAIKKNNCFSDSKSSFIKASSQTNCPLIRAADEGFLTISPGSDSNPDHPYVLLEQLDFKNPGIKKQVLQKLSIDISEIGDFYVQLDKIFILKRNAKINSISCFNLSDGQFIKDVCPTAQHVTGTTLRPILVPLPPEIIQIIYPSVNNCRDPFPGTALLALDYKV